MPKATFLNLPPEKRARFVDEALTEFATHPYDQASITSVVKRLGIAKGSVYQYFDGKLDLFGYLVEQARDRKAAWFQGLPTEGDDPYEQLAFAYRQGLLYWRAEPRWNRVALRLLEPSTDPGLQALRQRHERQIYTFLEGWLRQGVASGHVRADTDVPVAARLVHGLLSEGLLAAFLTRLGTDLDGFLQAPERFDPQLDVAVEVAEQAVAMLRRALA